MIKFDGTRKWSSFDELLMWEFFHKTFISLSMLK